MQIFVTTELICPVIEYLSPSENRARAIFIAFSDILVQTLEPLFLPTYLKHYQSTTYLSSLVQFKNPLRSLRWPPLPNLSPPLYLPTKPPSSSPASPPTSSLLVPTRSNLADVRTLVSPSLYLQSGYLMNMHKC